MKKKENNLSLWILAIYLALMLAFILISTSGISQVQKYWSYQKTYTKADYTELFTDTSKIIIEHNNDYKLLIISNRTTLEFIPIYSVKKEDIKHQNGLYNIKSDTYIATENKLPLIIEFLYNNEKLIQISLIRKENISTYIIQPLNEYL